MFRKQDAELIGKYLLNEVTELKMEINRTTKEIAEKLLKKIDETEKPLPKTPLISLGIELMDVPAPSLKV